MKTFYDELASHYHLIFEDWDATIKRQAAVLGSVLERELSSTELRVLDCACGIGTQTLGLAGCGHRVIGCDLSSAAVKRSARKPPKDGWMSRDSLRTCWI